MQCRAKFHVDFSETEGNFALHCTISFTFPSTQIEGNTTFFKELFPYNSSISVPQIKIHNSVSFNLLHGQILLVSEK